jgi:uncharacterized protein (TIGR02722 family)
MKRVTIQIVGGILLLSLVNGCAAFRGKVSEVDVNGDDHLAATYDFIDMRKITERVGENLVGSSFLEKAGEPPVMVVLGVENRTKGYVDMKPLTDRIRTIALKSGKARFVNAAQRDTLLKEQAYQAAQATPETKAKVARQLGAKYMLTGSLAQLQSESGKQVRLSKTEVNYYQLTMEITDLQSSEIVWTDEQPFAREARKPLIGW